jgi:hypothetical protein
MPRWRAEIIRNKAEHLGTVEAPDEKTAVIEAAIRFSIPGPLRRRIVVTRLDDKRD